MRSTTKATKLANGALSQFQTAHDDLVKANELLAHSKSVHASAAGAHLQAKAAAHDQLVRNQQVIDNLKGLIG